MGLNIGNWRRDSFYVKLDLKKYGLWVGQLTPEMRKIRGVADNIYQAYFYDTDRLTHEYEAKNWEEALVMAFMKKYAHVGGIMKNSKNKKMKRA